MTGILPMKGLMAAATYELNLMMLRHGVHLRNRVQLEAVHPLHRVPHGQGVSPSG
jgi:hypothetical protein